MGHEEYGESYCQGFGMRESRNAFKAIVRLGYSILFTAQTQCTEFECFWFHVYFDYYAVRKLDERVADLYVSGVILTWTEGVDFI